MEGEKTLIVAPVAALIATAMFVPSVSAATIIVGGLTGWDLSTNLTEWSASFPIFVNDSLLFDYSVVHDVIEVSQAGFAACDTSSAIAAYADGETFISMTQPGTRYFVCGRSNHCALGLKLQAQVLQPNTTDSNHPDNPSGSDGYDNKEHTPDSSSCDGARLSQAWPSLALCFCSFLFILYEVFGFLLDYLPCVRAAAVTY